MVSLGACDVAAVRYLLTEAGLHKARPERADRSMRHWSASRPNPVDVGALAQYNRPMPNLADYDTPLISTPSAGSA